MMAKLRLLASFLMVLSGSAFATPGVDVSAITDTVMKIRYTGGNPNSNHPAVTVTGKKLGVMATSTNTGGARAVTGAVTGYPMPSPWVNVGVAGAGYFGVQGRGNMGVYGEGTNTGVYGVGPTGVLGRSEGSNYVNIGVTGEAIGGYHNMGVYGSAWYGTNNSAGYFEGNVTAHNYLTISDGRAKRNVSDLTPAMERVMRVKPRSYDMAPGFVKSTKAQERRFGFVAQELEEVFPELVQTVSRPVLDAEGRLDPSQPPEEYKAVEYMSLIPVLMKAIQEQQEQIDALKAQLRGR